MATAEVNWAERRNALRQRTLKSGRIMVKGVQTGECLIRNMSLTGARIAVPRPDSLPDEFTLFIGDEGLHRECEVMSRTDTAAGLRFTRPLSARELGAEFMSAKTSEEYKAQRERAARDANRDAAAAAPRPVIATAPAMTTPVNDGIAKLRHPTLPDALVSRLPW